MSEKRFDASNGWSYPASSPPSSRPPSPPPAGELPRRLRERRLRHLTFRVCVTSPWRPITPAVTWCAYRPNSLSVERTRYYTWYHKPLKIAVTSGMVQCAKSYRSSAPERITSGVDFAFLDPPHGLIAHAQETH